MWFILLQNITGKLWGSLYEIVIEKNPWDSSICIEVRVLSCCPLANQFK